MTTTVVDIGGIPMSARIREAPRPRAVIVALHGGATDSGYFDAPDQPRLSLLATGAALGFTVIALDRPGYGTSAVHADRMASGAQRVDLAYAAVDRLLETRPRGAGVFLMAHSMGCVLAVEMAADERGADLLGLEIAGIGREYQPHAAVALEARRRNGPGHRTAGMTMRDIVWGPGHLYPEGAVGAPGLSASASPHESDDSDRWASDFPELAARVRVPVHYSLGDHEAVWRSGPPALAEVSELFTASARVAVDEQACGGHNLSLSRSAMAYHLKVLSFAEECVLARENADSGRKVTS